MADGARVRRARMDEGAALAALLYLPASDMYDRISGTRDRALQLIEADFRRQLARVTWVADLEGAAAGVMVAYRRGDAAGQVRRFLPTVARYTPLWRWPAVVRLLWMGHRRSPRHPSDWLYVDALATAPEHRRRGVASALLQEAERIAASAGLRAIGLDTSEANTAALALYESAGFQVVEMLPAKPPIPAGVIMVKDVLG